jgi:hypothetical protein
MAPTQSPLVGVIFDTSLRRFYSRTDDITHCFRCKLELENEMEVAVFGQVTDTPFANPMFKSTKGPLLLGGVFCAECVTSWLEWLK